MSVSFKYGFKVKNPATGEFENVGGIIGGSGGSGGGAFYVTIQGANGIYTSDKTNAEVYAAYLENKTISCVLTASESSTGLSVENTIAPLIMIYEESAAEYGCSVGNTGLQVIQSTEGISVEIISLATIDSKLPNPNAITFTGAVTGSYDGTSAKTFNIPTIAGEAGKDGNGISNITITEV